MSDQIDHEVREMFKRSLGDAATITAFRIAGGRVAMQVLALISLSHTVQRMVAVVEAHKDFFAQKKLSFSLVITTDSGAFPNRIIVGIAESTGETGIA
jgi:hypothetical protein